jgi:hypothetical protein
MNREQWWDVTGPSEVCLHGDRHPAVTLSTTNPAWTSLLNPGLRDEGPATSPLRVH